MLVFVNTAQSSSGDLKEMEHKQTEMKFDVDVWYPVQTEACTLFCLGKSGLKQIQQIIAFQGFGEQNY